MEIRKVLAHSCFQRKKGLEKDTPLSPKKCRCREWVAAELAAKEVELGVAQYVVAVDKTVLTDQYCGICAGVEPLKKSCTWCKGTGIIRAGQRIIILGVDIIRTVSEDGKKNVTTTQIKKSPTIEAAHIHRAYVEGNKAAQLRIEEYGELTRESLAKLIVGYEPEDDRATGSGRLYDYGRSL